MATKIPVPAHPFYPPELELLNYVANTWSITQLLSGFFATWGLILGATYVVSKRYNPKLSGVDTACVLWFTLSGTIHFFFEGYFSYNHTRMSSQQDLFGQLWKEYANSDSRYLTSDPFVLCMETVTAALWGPLSFLAIYLIASNNPYRHQIQSLVSIGQIYGDVLYYATNHFALVYSGISYSRPEALYYWFYYVTINAIWIAVPGALLYQSFTATARAFKVEEAVKVNGKVNGYANGKANGAAKKHT